MLVCYPRRREERNHRRTIPLIKRRVGEGPGTLRILNSTNFACLFPMPLEVELFNNYVIPDPLLPLASSCFSFGMLSPTSDILLTIQDNQTPSSTDLVALQDILQSLESGGFVTPPKTTRLPTMTLVPDPACQGLSSPLDHSQSIDWTALLNEDPSEPNNDSLCSQSQVNSALPEIDLPMPQFPLLWAVEMTC